MVEKVGVKPEDWGKMNRTPVAKVFKIDINRNTTTLAKVCDELRNQYKGNQFALAQIALFDPNDKASQLHSKALKEARELRESDASLTLAELREFLLGRFPDLATLPGENLDNLINHNTF